MKVEFTLIKSELKHKNTAAQKYHALQLSTCSYLFSNMADWFGRNMHQTIFVMHFQQNRGKFAQTYFEIWVNIEVA